METSEDSAIETLHKRLLGVIDEFRDDFFPIVSAIGVLELIKAGLIEESRKEN